MPWIGSFRRGKRDPSADRRGTASDVGNRASEDEHENENGRPTGKVAAMRALVYELVTAVWWERIKLAEMQALVDKLVGLRRIKLEAEDGYTTHSFDGLARPAEDCFFNARVGDFDL